MKLSPNYVVYAKGRKSFESEWEGILENVQRRYRETSSDSVRST